MPKNQLLIGLILGEISLLLSNAQINLLTMKNLILSLVFISTYCYVNAQNTFPTSGNVGINTTTPSARLDVNGSMKVDSCLIVKDSLIVQKDMRGEGDLRVEGDAYFLGDMNALGDVVFDQMIKMHGLAEFTNYSSSDLEFLVKTPDGNIYRGSRDLVIAMMYSKGCVDIPPGDVTNPAWANGVNKIFVHYPCANPVNVGIGTETPAFRLDVRALAYFREIKVGVSAATEDALVNIFDPTNSVDLVHVGVHNTITGNQSDVRFKISHKGAIWSKNLGDAPSFVIENGTGNALVIYDSDGEKIFQVQDDGLLRSREIRVDNNNSWPDFVFEDDYILRPLKDVESYIQKYKKLPGIPSAIDIDENGLNIAEMQNLQMQKIEELTLYVIDMQKQIDSLNGRIVVLENQ